MMVSSSNHSLAEVQGRLLVIGGTRRQRLLARWRCWTCHPLPAGKRGWSCLPVGLLWSVEWSPWGRCWWGEQGHQHIPPARAGQVHQEQEARSVLSQKDNNYTNQSFSSMARSSRAQGCRANTRVLVLYVDKDMGLFMQYNSPSSQAY